MMREEAVGDFIWGGLVAIIGGTITVVTYLGASAGESYVVAWGALLYGGFRLIRGLSKWLS